MKPLLLVLRKKVLLTVNSEANEMVFEDISSSSPRRKRESAAEVYAEGAFKNIDKVIKAISFLISIGTFLIFAGIAVVLALFDPIFTILSIGLAIFGILFSLILLFLIFGLGHIITQNKEILKRL